MRTTAPSPPEEREDGLELLLSHAPDRTTVLLVDDDPSTLDMFQRALTHAGFAVRTSSTGHSAMKVARQYPIDVMLLDLNLPDISGLEVLRRCAAEDRPERFILVSGCLSIETSVEAMRLGAFDVIEKPVSIDRLLSAVQACVRTPGTDRPPHADSAAIHLPQTDGPPGSAAHRWAMYVVKACESETDVRTIEDWARAAGVSYSTLCESCRIIGIRPHAARDLARTLRALIKSAVYQCEPSVLLAVSDRRTLKSLLGRAGPGFQVAGGTSVAQFIRDQQFVASSNAGIRVLLGYFD